FIVAAPFGVWVEVHSALQEVRHTDLADFLRAGWAVRIGNDPYQIVEEHGWHYNFPPLFAIVVAPLADPPRGADNRGMVPFPVSVAIWYVLSLCLLAAASNLVASALEQTVGGDRMRNLRPTWQWWRMRLLPILICIRPIGFTLSRGQVNLLLLFLLCAMIAAVIARQPVRAGLWLAGAVCLKVFPLYLVVYPLWRRDWRFLAGLAGGLAMGLVLIPVAVLGMNRTGLYYSELTRAVFEPALIGGFDHSPAGAPYGPSAADRS